MKQIESKLETNTHKWQMGLFICVIAALAVAMSGVAVARPKCDPPPCQSDDSGSSAYYDVTISESMEGVGEYWMASTNGQVNYQHFDPAPSTGFLDLSFFRNYFTLNGDTCFPAGDVQLHAVILKYKKRTGAQAQFWFHGFTYDNTSVTYFLTLNGNLVKKDWPPASSNRMYMNTWNMRLANEGSGTQEISCLMEGGDFSTATGQVSIDVFSVPPPTTP